MTRRRSVGLSPLTALISLFFVGTTVGPVLAKPNASRLSVKKIDVSSRVIKAFEKSGGKGERFGRLRFRGGLVLSSSDPAFGGLSGLEISPDGKRLLAVSDAGAWLKAELVYRDTRPAGLAKVTIGPLLALRAKRLRRERDRDAEALRLIDGNLENGTVLAGFESNQRIGFFKLKKGNIGAPTRYIRPPRRLKRNKGIEAVGVLKAGRYKRSIVAFAERTLDTNGHHSGWLWHKGKTKPIALTNVGGFDVTDVVGGFAGELFVLERRFRWSEGVKMRLRRVSADKIKPGAVLSGEILVQADLGQEIDNMEGLALHRDRAKRTILTMVSDDNFNGFLQRTLLLQFELPESGSTRAAK